MDLGFEVAAAFPPGACAWWPITEPKSAKTNHGRSGAKTGWPAISTSYCAAPAEFRRRNKIPPPGPPPFPPGQTPREILTRRVVPRIATGTSNGDAGQVLASEPFRGRHHPQSNIAEAVCNTA